MMGSKSDEALAEYEKRPWLKWYPKGVPADIEVPERSITDMVDEATEKWGDRTALIFYGKRMKHREIRDLSLRFAAALHDLGIGKGDAVAMLLPNCPQFMIAFFGILRLGAVATTMSPLYTPREVAHQLKDSGANTIVCLDLLYEKVEKVWEEAGLKHAIVTSISEYLPASGRLFGKIRGQTLEAEVPERPGVIMFRELVGKYPPNPPDVEIDPKEDLAVLPYTGGTTGVPKGSMLTHYNLAAVQEQIWRAMPDMEEGGEVGIAVLPFYHIYGQSVIMLSGALRGGMGVVFARPELDGILDAVERHGVTLFYGVPTLYKYLADEPRTKRIDWRKVKYCFCGADTLHKAIRDDWREVAGVEIHEGYGLTETSAVTHTNPAGRNKPGTFGIPIPSTHAAIADLERDDFLPPGEQGELVVSGPQVMRGYWKKPEENERSFLEAGGRSWFRTGDVAWMDEEGYFHFVERTKDLIKYKGLSVYPHEIEDVLHDNPKVKEAAIIGVPDPKVGERVKAIVVLESDYRGKVTEDEIIKWCEERLAHYKVPKMVEFRGEVPKTDVGKADHRKLREELFRLEGK